MSSATSSQERRVAIKRSAAETRTSNMSAVGSWREKKHSKLLFVKHHFSTWLQLSTSIWTKHCVEWTVHVFLLFYSLVVLHWSHLLKVLQKLEHKCRWYCKDFNCVLFWRTTQRKPVWCVIHSWNHIWHFDPDLASLCLCVCRLYFSIFQTYYFSQLEKSTTILEIFHLVIERNRRITQLISMALEEITKTGNDLKEQHSGFNGRVLSMKEGILSFNGFFWIEIRHFRWKLKLSTGYETQAPQSIAGSAHLMIIGLWRGERWRSVCYFSVVMNSTCRMTNLSLINEDLHYVLLINQCNVYDCLESNYDMV